MLFITHRLQAYFLQITSGRWPPFTSMHCCVSWSCRTRVSVGPHHRSQLLQQWLVWFLNSPDTPPEHMVFHEPPQEKIWYGIPRRYATMSTNSEPSSEDTLHFCHRLRFVITTNTGNTVLHVPTLHCSWPYEMASSLLPFPFPPTTTSYRAGAIFKCEMCQSAPRHPVHYIYIPKVL
jgi:hypothetical protein